MEFDPSVPLVEFEELAQSVAACEPGRNFVTYERKLFERIDYLRQAAGVSPYVAVGAEIAAAQVDRLAVIGLRVI